METIEKLKLEVEPYKNTLVISDLNKVMKLHNVMFDESDEEFYWVFFYKDRKYFSSVLLEWIPLKGYIPKDKYERLVKIWNLNNNSKAI